MGYPECLCTAKEDGVVELWDFPRDMASTAAAEASGPCFRWEPSKTEVCTALAVSSEGWAKQHFLMAATMPGQNLQGGMPAGSLWIAGLPEPIASRNAPWPHVSSNAAPTTCGIGAAILPEEKLAVRCECGNIFDADSVFCRHCGKKQPAP